MLTALIFIIVTSNHSPPHVDASVDVGVDVSIDASVGVSVDVSVDVGMSDISQKAPTPTATIAPIALSYTSDDASAPLPADAWYRYAYTSQSYQSTHVRASPGWHAGLPHPQAAK